MAGQLLDKVAVVTGGASGIGRASALRFAVEGASIVIGDLDAPRGEETTTAIRANGGSAIFVHTDTTSDRKPSALNGVDWSPGAGSDPKRHRELLTRMGRGPIKRLRRGGANIHASRPSRAGVTTHLW